MKREAYHLLLQKELISRVSFLHYIFTPLFLLEKLDKLEMGKFKYHLFVELN